MVSRLPSLFVVIATAVVVGALSACVTSYAVWRTTAEQPSSDQATAIAQELVPGGRLDTLNEGGNTGGGLPSWLWFDEPGDGGQTEVALEAPDHQLSGRPRAEQLIATMRSAGWQAGLQSPDDTDEVEGIRDGVYLHASLTPADDTYRFELVRDSWPALKAAVALAWVLGAAAGALIGIRLRRTRRLRLAAALAFAAVPTAIASLSLVHFLTPGRQSFALDVWGAYPLSLSPPLILGPVLLTTLVLAIGGSRRSPTNQPA
jgi:hypothetical protein